MMSTSLCIEAATCPRRGTFSGVREGEFSETSHDFWHVSYSKEINDAPARCGPVESRQQGFPPAASPPEARNKHAIAPS